MKNDKLMSHNEYKKPWMGHDCISHGIIKSNVLTMTELNTCKTANNRTFDFNKTLKIILLIFGELSPLTAL